MARWAFGTQVFYLFIFLNSLNCDAGGRVARELHSAGNYFSDGQITFVAVSWLKVRGICPFQYKTILRTLQYLSNGHVSKSIEVKICVCTVMQNNGMQSGAKGLNRFCLLLISGQELFSFKTLLMCRQWNISSAYSLFLSSNCISSFTVTHLQKLQQIRAGLQYRLILLSFLLLLRDFSTKHPVSLTKQIEFHYECF